MLIPPGEPDIPSKLTSIIEKLKWLYCRKVKDYLFITPVK